MTAVQDILRSFGITRCYKGFKHTEYAICLAIQDESRLEAITKEIYMETAAHFEWIFSNRSPLLSSSSRKA